MLTDTRSRVASSVVLLALVFLPAPLLPPHRLAEVLQSLLGMGWKAAYLLAALGLHIAVCGSLGAAATMAVPPAPTARGRRLQLLMVPLMVATAMLIVRTLKLGHWPVLATAAVPLAACLFGAGLGLLLRQRGAAVALLWGGVALVGWGWALFPGAPQALSRNTGARLRSLAADAPTATPGRGSFSGVMSLAFTPGSASADTSALEQNRAAILALGIAIGHERLARLTGLDPQSEAVRRATLWREGTTLEGRPDWARHFFLSAALSVLEHPLVSEAGGLVKEELDALDAHGSGFSFGDLLADRAGVRFARAATDSEEAAAALRARLREGADARDFFPPASDLPEGLTADQFRRDYGGIGSERYRQTIREIETRLDRCEGLRP